VLNAVLCVGAEALVLLLLGPLSPNGLQREDAATLGVYLVALLLALTSGILLPQVTLGMLLLARSRLGTPQGDRTSSATDAAAPSIPAPSSTSAAAHQPPPRLALISVVAGLYTPVAAPLAVVLTELARAASGPPVCQPGIEHCLPGVPGKSVLVNLLGVLVGGLVLIVIPAVGVAIVSGHVALSRLRRLAAPTRWRTLAWWGLLLGYSTFPVVFGLYGLVVVTSGIFSGGE
jgi:hypothetical protein